MLGILWHTREDGPYFSWSLRCLEQRRTMSRWVSYQTRRFQRESAMEKTKEGDEGQWGGRWEGQRRLGLQGSGTKPEAARTEVAKALRHEWTWVTPGTEWAGQARRTATWRGVRWGEQGPGHGPDKEVRSDSLCKALDGEFKQVPESEAWLNIWCVYQIKKPKPLKISKICVIS